MIYIFYISMEVPKIFLIKGTQVSEVHLAEYMDMLSMRMLAIKAEMGDKCYFDYDKKIISEERGFRLLFRDDKGTLVMMRALINDEDVPIAFATVREVSPEHIFVHQVQFRNSTLKVELLPHVLHHIKEQYPGKISYGLIHSTNVNMHRYLKSIGAIECDFMFQDEHPYFTPEDGWIAFLQK